MIRFIALVNPGPGNSHLFQFCYISVILKCKTGGSVVKNLPAQTDVSLISGSGGSPGEGNSNPLQYSCLENSMDRRVWRGPWGYESPDTT